MVDKISILVVEDEEKIRSALADFLEFHNFEVTEAADGLDVLDVLEHRFDLDPLDPALVAETEDEELVVVVDDGPLRRAIVFFLFFAQVRGETPCHDGADRRLQERLTAALRSAGAAILAVDLVMSDKHHAAFCCVRPPGHHAERSRAMGFCFFNNIAVGAAHALEAHGIGKIAILDFDVHQGNGTEEIFATPGCESNVKEIYDACNELALDPGNFVLNQFSEFGNHLGHYRVTGRAADAEDVLQALDELKL